MGALNWVQELDDFPKLLVQLSFFILHFEKAAAFISLFTMRLLSLESTLHNCIIFLPFFSYNLSIIYIPGIIQNPNITRDLYFLHSGFCGFISHKLL
jgi:hypothetical protein